jgi:hypothetical protein
LLSVIRAQPSAAARSVPNKYGSWPALAVCDSGRIGRFCVVAVATGNGPPAALKVLRERRDYIDMMSSLNSGLSQPGRRPEGVRHGW